MEKHITVLNCRLSRRVEPKRCKTTPIPSSKANIPKSGMPMTSTADSIDGSSLHFTFTISRAGAEVRRVWLKNIAGIFAGQEPEGLSTPLDDLCATMIMRPSGEMITFRLEHVNARDTFVMCMMLFAQSQGAEITGLPGEAQSGDEEDGVELVVEEAQLSSAMGSHA